MKECQYYEAQGIDYSGQLKKIPKAKNNFLQPLFEAFTNSLEAIKMLKSSNKKEIKIKLNFSDNLFSNETEERNFQSLEISDNGIGFTDKEFQRLQNIHDDSKGITNKGSERLQLIHFFDRAIYESVYRNNQSKTGFCKRNFTLSKSEDFLENHAILYFYKVEDIEVKQSYTKLTLKKLLETKDQNFYDQLTPEFIKQELINRYLEYFAANRDILPLISIETSLSDEHVVINSEDIEQVDKEETIEISYKKLDKNNYVKIDKTEKFIIKSFVIPSNKLEKNTLKLTSKQEIVSNENIVKKLHLDILKPEETIEDKRYLFLVSSNYIDQKDNDNRGEIELYTEEEAKETLVKDEEIILLDDIHDNVNSKILSMYNEIMQIKTKHEEEIEKLQKMFLLNKETLKKLKSKININDTDESILKKVYKADVEIIAKKDAKIKEKIDQLDTFDLSYSKQEDYNSQLNQQIEELVEVIPLQNRTALTHTVARRKLVLDLFDRVLNRSLDMQNIVGDRNIDEELLHNLIFKQKSNNPDESDLWLISEDYIYFKGVSESRLDNIEINGEKLFKNDSELSKEALQYKKSLNQDRDAKKQIYYCFQRKENVLLLNLKIQM